MSISTVLIDIVHGELLVALFGMKSFVHALVLAPGAGTYYVEKVTQFMKKFKSLGFAVKDGKLDATEQIREYLSGRRRKFDIDIQLLWGTDFQKKVWHETMKIPYGQTISYKMLAKRIVSPKAARAVGAALAANPIPIIIPCHRVIGKAGNLVGFGGGIKLKEKLLSIEGTLLI